MPSNIKAVPTRDLRVGDRLLWSGNQGDVALVAAISGELPNQVASTVLLTLRETSLKGEVYIYDLLWPLRGTTNVYTPRPRKKKVAS